MAQLIDDEAMVPIIYPWQNHTSAMAGMASWARGKITRMWDVCSPPSNDRDPMHILRILLDCC